MLEALYRGMMTLYVCSNSAPLLDPVTGNLPTSAGTPGGLVPMVVSLLRARGGDWFYAVPKSDSSPLHRDPRITLHPIHFDAATTNSHYNLVSRETLLWLFHYLFDTSVEPNFTPGLKDAIEVYKVVNRTFARKIMQEAANDRNASIFVNDYHLALVPQYLREESDAMIIYFHHVPWCSPAYFRLLPSEFGLELLRSLLKCDVVGFHSREWADAFVECCVDLLGAETVGREHLNYKDRRVRVVVAAGPVDAGVIDRLRMEPSTDRFAGHLSLLQRSRQMIVRVDRVDLWKNINRGFAAFELMLERERALRDSVWFCAVLSAPRVSTRRHIEYRKMCEHMAMRINDRFGGPNRPNPIDIIYPSAHDNTRHRAVAALRAADITLVNPTFDGLNLVAKEAIIAGESSLILSTGAGAFEQLRRAITPVNPFDLEMTRDVLRTALDDPTDATGSRAALGLGLRQETANAWFDALTAVRD